MNCSRPMDALLLSPSILGVRACVLNTEHVCRTRSTRTEYGACPLNMEHAS